MDYYEIIKRLKGIKHSDDCVECTIQVQNRIGGDIYTLPLNYPSDEVQYPLRYKGMEYGEIIDAHQWNVVDNGKWLIDIWADEFLNLTDPKDLASAIDKYGYPGDWIKIG